MKYRHNITQNHSIVNATDDTSDALLCARTLAQPVCISPALVAILPHPANLASTTGNYQAGGD